MIGTRPKTTRRQLCEIRARDSFLREAMVGEKGAKGWWLKKEGLPGVVK